MLEGRSFVTITITLSMIYNYVMLVVDRWSFYLRNTGAYEIIRWLGLNGTKERDNLYLTMGPPMVTV